MQCKTFSHINNGRKVYKPKTQFATMDRAIVEAKRVNALPTTINKIVSYKCKECYQYHVVRNGKPIKKKYF